MTLEAAAYINALNPTYPEGASTRTEADDHLRLIKSTVVATFPTVSATVAPTHSAMNTLIGNSTPLQTRFATIDAWPNICSFIKSAVSTSVSAARTDITALAAALPLREVFRGTMTASQSVYTFGAGTLAGANRLTVFLNKCGMKGAAVPNLLFKLGTAGGGIISSGYVGNTMAYLSDSYEPTITGTTTSAAAFAQMVIDDTTPGVNLKLILERVSGNTWMVHAYGTRDMPVLNVVFFYLGSSVITLAEDLYEMQFSFPGGTMFGLPVVTLWAEELP